MHDFIIEGQITRDDGNTGVAGLVVDIADRYLLFYDILGHAR